jgi:hypothetical protein
LESIAEQTRPMMQHAELQQKKKKKNKKKKKKEKKT